MPSPWKVSPSPSLSACTSFLNERSIAKSFARLVLCANPATSISVEQRKLPAPYRGWAPFASFRPQPEGAHAAQVRQEPHVRARVSKDVGGPTDLGFNRDRHLICASRQQPTCGVGAAACFET